MIALFTLDAGKAKMRIPALEVFVDDLAYKRAPAAKSGLVVLFPAPF